MSGWRRKRTAWWALGMYVALTVLSAAPWGHGCGCGAGACGEARLARTLALPGTLALPDVSGGTWLAGTLALPEGKRGCAACAWRAATSSATAAMAEAAPEVSDVETETGWAGDAVRGVAPRGVSRGPPTGVA